MKLTAEGARAILRNVSYPGMEFIVGSRPLFEEDSPGHGAVLLYLQLKWTGPCNKTGAEQEWTSRKWLLSEHMTKSEIVTTALKAVLTAVEHEAREQFKFKGAAIFGPHFNVEHMLTMALKPHALDVRDPV